MPSKFADACKAERAAIDVPPAPMIAIRSGLQRAATEARRPWLRALVVAGCALALVAAVTATWKNTRVWVGEGHVRMTSRSFATIAHPTQAQVLAAARSADFPVTLPAGLPAGSVPVSLVRAGTSAIMLRYRLPGEARGNASAPVILANPKSFDIERANATPQGDLGTAKWLQVGMHIVAIFRVRGEIVIVPKSVMTTHELNAMEQAMGEGQDHYLSPSGAFAQNPTLEDVQRVAMHGLSFKAVLPAGLPKGSREIAVARMDGMILLQYDLPGAWRASNHIGSIWLASSRQVDASERAIGLHMPHSRIMERFAAGDETVLISTSSFTSRELARIRAATQALAHAQGR